MAHRESWSVVNYGQRGRRGYPGRGVTSIQLDSEGYLWAYYTDMTSEGIGHIPMGEPGEKGEPGDIVDVLVNGVSVTSEGIAYITMGSEGPTYEAGENISIENNVISAVDTVYTAGDNIVIDSENVISSPLLIDKDITVTEDVGGYAAGDQIPANTPIRQIIETILAPAPRPEPPTQNLSFWGVTGSRTSGPPTGIESTFASEVIDPAIAQRDNVVKYYTTVKQYACFAYPASMPDLVHIVQSDLFDVIGAWTKIECSYNGQDYKMYYSSLTQQTNSKYEFKWR